MADIYQQIWSADQSENGVSPILDTQNGDETTGFVKVATDLDSNNRDLKVLKDVKIPDGKRHTYQLCRRLFDNYALREKDHENDTPQEREEIHDLVNEMIDTAPMQVARDYVATQTGTSLTRGRWYNTIMEMWFRQFSMGGDPELSGFEHVVVGEQQGSKAQGYHFWYKYHLDDGFARQVDGDHSGAFPGLDRDRIIYLGSKLQGGQDQFPETVTISYRWNAPDYDRQAMRPLTKPIGGFFVGCSVEGLLALGTVRAHAGARAPVNAVIEGAEYELKLFHDSSRRHVRTFYPKFKGTASVVAPPASGDVVPPPVTASPVRIIAALVNPEGHDPGHESVTIINIGRHSLPLDGWKLVDKNSRSTALAGTITAGETHQIKLDGQGVQLSNKGGEIRLVNGHGQSVHVVTYSKGQVREQGATILF